MTTIGIISDTHGYLSETACTALQGVSRIVHAGDIGGPQILDRLAEIAPVTAVRGNMDGGQWAEALGQTEVVEIADGLLYVVHDFYRLDVDPAAAGFHAVISGHTHRSAIRRQNGVLLINPGSASQPRHGTRPSIAILNGESGRINARIVEIDR